MPPTRKRNSHHTLRQQRVQHHNQLQREQQNQVQHQSQQQPQDQQPVQHQDKQIANGQNSNNANRDNAHATNQVNLRAPLSKVKKEEAGGDSQVASNIRDAVHKDIQEIIEADLYCAICRDIYINPLILNCAHSFCRFCLNNWLSKQVGCPSCRMVVVFQTENLALKNIINKMMQTSSQVFQDERKQSLDQRSKAELSQDQEDVRPLMERRSFLPNGRVRQVYLGDKVIRPWRGPNGATIWRTQLDNAGQVVRPEIEDLVHRDRELSSDTEDDADYDDEDEDGNIFEPTQSDLENTDEDDEYEDEEIDDDPEYDESGSSDIDVDSDESYASSRRRRMNDLNILAGYAPADDDEDFDIDIEIPEAGLTDTSDDDSSMDDETESHDESMFEAFGAFSRRAVVGSTTDEDVDDDDDDEDEANIEADVMNLSTDSSSEDDESTDTDSSSNF